MITVGVVFIILLPLFSGKRSFCGLICPFGAWQSFFGRINPFRVTINKETCVSCGACEQTCPVFAIEKRTEKPFISAYCNRCGTCIDSCPNKSITYTVFGRDARTALIFCGLIVGGAMGALFVPQTLYGLWTKFF